MLEQQRSVQVLNPMSEEESKTAGLESAVGYFSATYDKENNAPKSSSKEWYRFADISLGNGGKGNLAKLKSDRVGVVTRWDYPTNASFTEGVTDEQLRSIKNLLKIGEHRKDNQATDWAGYKVAKVLGIPKDTMTKEDRTRITRMLAVWVKERHLKEIKITVDGHKKPCLTTT
jgi:hypothetical protein